MVLAVVRRYFLLNFGTSALHILQQGLYALQQISPLPFFFVFVWVFLLMLIAFPSPTAGSTLSTMVPVPSWTACQSVPEPPQCTVQCFKVQSCSGNAEQYPVALGVTWGWCKCVGEVPTLAVPSCLISSQASEILTTCCLPRSTLCCGLILFMSLKCSLPCCPKGIPSSLQILLLLIPFPLTLPSVRFAVSLVNVFPVVLSNLSLSQFPCLHLSRVIIIYHPWAISFPLGWCRTVLVLSLTCHKNACCLFKYLFPPLMQLYHFHRYFFLLLPTPVLLSLHTVTCLEAVALSFLTPSAHSVADHKSGYVSHGLKWFSLPWTDFLTSLSCSGTTSPSSLPD